MGGLEGYLYFRPALLLRRTPPPPFSLVKTVLRSICSDRDIACVMVEREVHGCGVMGKGKGKGRRLFVTLSSHWVSSEQVSPTPFMYALW